MPLIDKLSYYLTLPFVRNALIVAMLIAICASLLGVILVLKRYSMIGTGLSNLAFGVTAIAAVLNLTSNMLLTLPVTIGCAVLLLKKGQGAKIKGDAAIAMISAGSLALGYLIINMFSSSANISADVCTTLFGSTSILTLSKADVWISLVLSLVVLLVYLLFYNKIFAITFDEDFTTATGVKAGSYNLIVAVITAVVIVLAMNLVGALLIAALIIFPVMSATKLFKSFLAVVICSGVTAVICAVIGILTAALAGTPVGSTIVAANLAVFILFYLTSFAMGGVKN